MAIYADKKHGKLTGQFRVEVQREGQRLRARCASLPDAKAKEAELKQMLLDGPQLTQDSQVIPEAHAPSKKPTAAPETILEALKKAQDQMWGGKSLEIAGPTQVRECLKHIGMDKRIDEIKTEDIDDLIPKLASSGKNGSRSDATVNRHLSALNKLLKWCKQRRYLSELPTIEWQDEETHRIRWLTHDEEDQLLDLLESYGAHDVADFCRVALDTGMRKSEIRGIETQDIQGVWVHLWKTKTNKPRSIPLTDRALEVLQSRMDTGLFGNLHIERIRHFWNKAKREMGLQNDEGFVVHAMRHTRATRLVEQGENLMIIKQLLGHSTIVTTQRYAHVSDQSLLNAIRHTGHEVLSSVVAGESGGGIRGIDLRTPAATHADTEEKHRYINHLTKPADVVEQVDTQDLKS